MNEVYAFLTDTGIKAISYFEREQNEYIQLYNYYGFGNGYAQVGH